MTESPVVRQNRLELEIAGLVERLHNIHRSGCEESLLRQSSHESVDPREAVRGAERRKAEVAGLQEKLMAAQAELGRVNKAVKATRHNHAHREFRSFRELPEPKPDQVASLLSKALTAQAARASTSRKTPSPRKMPSSRKTPAAASAPANGSPLSKTFLSCFHKAAHAGLAAVVFQGLERQARALVAQEMGLDQEGA